MCWICIVQVFFFISCLFKGTHCQQAQYIRVRPNDTEASENQQSVEFQCHVDNKARSVELSKDGYSLVPPQALSINDLPAANNIEVRQGDKVVLYCKAVGSKPPTQLIWYKNDKEIFDEDAQMSFDEDKQRRYTTTSSVTLYPGVDDNGAIYSCEARHPALERYLRCSVAINVLHAPGIPQIEGYIEGDVLTSGDTLTLACIARGGNPPPQLIWKRGNVQVDATYTVSGHVTTNIHTFRVDASDNGGVYRCEACNYMTKVPLAASVKLSVHYPPSNVKLIGPLEAKKGDTVTLTCSTEASNPPSQITWVVDGSRLVGGESVTNRLQDGWTTSSNLTITLTRQDPDVKTFACYAENPPVRKKTFRTHKIAVTCEYLSSHLSFSEGKVNLIFILTSLKVTLTCTSSSSNPLARISWKRDGRHVRDHVEETFSADYGAISTRSVLTFSVTSADDRATFECRAKSDDLPAVSSNVTFRVRHKPEFPDPYQRMDVAEGTNATVNVSVYAYPPVAWFSWTKDSALIPPVSEKDDHAHRVTSSGSALVIFGVTRADSGTYVCMAENEEGTSNATIILNVQSLHMEWPARFPDLNPIEHVWDALGRRLAALNPPPQTFAALDTALQEQWLPLPEEQIDCIIDSITHRYPAVVVNVTSTVVVAEGDNAYFECIFSANPILPDMVRWSTKGGEPILRENQQFTENGRSLLTLFNVTKGDSGTLECEAFNGLGDPDMKVANLVVLYKPSIVRNLVTSKMALELSSTAELRCFAEGDGNISFVWSFNSTVILQGLDIGRYDIRTAKTGDSQWCSVLTIKRVRQDDFGEYTCVAKNHLGYDFIKFSLSKKGAPEHPHHLKTVTQAPDSITLSWTPGFDGGAEQNFRIRFKKSGSSIFYYREAPTNATSYTISGLEPGEQYDFFIAAYNDFGESSFTENVLSVATKSIVGKDIFKLKKIAI
ncbi:nephrin-like [Uloborus diversus]|uniref:nephrin-like n=1 Tax=Uloborus diversus TaxID=327109 RepID=UPI00240A38C0|nr:nephrin-like [Uloborus diversus]